MFGLELLEILKIVFLFLGVFFTGNIIVKVMYKNTITGLRFMFWSVGVVGFIYLQFLY